MRTKPFLIAALAAGLTVAALPARADRDSAGAGIVIGGAIGAVLAGPPGWVAGMVIGAAVGEGEDTRNARIHGGPAYAIAPPPPGFRGVPPDYLAPRAAYYPPVHAAPRVVYAAPVYYGPPRRSYRPYYY